MTTVLSPDQAIRFNRDLAKHAGGAKRSEYRKNARRIEEEAEERRAKAARQQERSIRRRRGSREFRNAQRALREMGSLVPQSVLDQYAGA